ncbi:hypothetical protein ASD04_02635 [Devosia sp. Root436]|nr:hypothetical protein ASD04_02635 [Devosia sp. Root436]
MALNIGFLVFPNVQQLDLTGPYEVFASAGLAVHLAWKGMEPVRSATGLMLTPTVTLDGCDSGTPETATPELVALARHRMAGSRAERERLLPPLEPARQ